MSDSSKRPGARDISDLKARLGLKKGPAAGQPGQPTQVPAATGRSPGMVAPPGARGAPIPAPPGAQPPMQARPSIPDASHDPFAAMNAMAAHGAAAAQPQIVIVNDGKPVESVEHKRGGLKLVLYAAAFIIPLAIGAVVGKIAAQHKAFNESIGDAGRLRDDVKVIGKGMIAVQQVLQLGRERGPGGNSFLVNDEKLTAELEALTLVEPAFDLLTQLSMREIGDVLAKETMELYSETARLNAAIKDHISRSKSDAKAMNEAKGKAGGMYGYGALVELPAAEQAGAPVTVKLVQLGKPVCGGDGKPSDAPCSGPPTGFQYRLEDGGSWGTGKVATAATGAADGAMVLLSPASKVLEGLVKGGGPTVAEVAYTKRIRDISDKVDLLVELRKNVETKLNNVANRDTLSTFFL